MVTPTATEWLALRRLVKGLLGLPVTLEVARRVILMLHSARYYFYEKGV